MITGYIKTTSEKGISKEGEKNLLISYARKNTLNIDCFIQAPKLKTEDLAKMNAGDLLLVPNTAAFGKNFEDILNTVKVIFSLGINLRFIKEDLDIRAKETYSFTQSAQICLKLYKGILSVRNKAIQDKLLEDGKQRGRPTGTKNKTNIFQGKASFIHENLLQGKTKSEIARLLGCSRPSLYSFLRTET